MTNLYHQQILYMFALRAKVTIFVAKTVNSFARSTNIYKLCKLHIAIFSVFYNISQPNFAVLPILRSPLKL